MTPSRSIFVAPLAAVAVLAVAILLLTGGSARAATPTYADPGGTCASLTPCFTTVQEAVDNAGPAPAVVNIFPGTYAESVDLADMGSAIAGSAGDITLQAVDAAGDAAVGTVTISPVSGIAIYESAFPFAGSVTINGVIATSPDSDVFDFYASGNISLSDTTTNDSGGNDGVDVFSDADITITNATANNNIDGGFNLETSGGNITITGSTANGNTDAEGFDLETDNDISITGTEASGNWDEGIEIDPYDASEAGNVTITDVVTNDSESDYGIDVDATNVTITNTTANGNGDEGIQTIAGTTVIDRVTTYANFSDGIDVEGLTSKAFFADNISVINSDTRDNSESGIESLEPPTVISGAVAFNSNVICGNAGGGVESLDDDPNNAEGNWWGAATGPTHPLNPAGTGDDVFDGANPGLSSALGTVDFDPFITTSSGSGSATVGLASTISFQFTGPGGTPALQEGPGDETGTSPFTVTTDNGTATVGFITGGKLGVSLTAATVGTANVTVTGPCGLASATLPVSVAAAVGTPVATPVQLPDTGGSAHGNG